MSSASTPPAPRIADYELSRLIGRGSYGDVWLARSVTGAFRAVKVVWRDRFPEARPYEREFEGITRFTAISLREPSQLALLHVGQDQTGGFFYYVMELADDAHRGREIVADEYVPFTLRELHRRRGRLTVAEVVALGVALARALASLHSSGLVHRDIKPSNIVFIGGVPKLADVGLVAAASEGMTFVGTEGYVPPEGPGAPSADVFSLGKVLYELATGLDREDYPRLPADIGTMPDRVELLELNEVLIRACDPDPKARHVNATALLDDLLLLQAGKSVRHLRKTERRTAQALRVAAFLATVAVIAGIGAGVERRRANAELARRERAEAERDAAERRAAYTTRLAGTRSALDQAEYGRARQFLREAIPAAGKEDLRGFEWHALAADAAGDPSIVLRASGSAGRRVRFSRLNNLLATHTADSEIVLWDPATGRERGRIAGVNQLADFSADGRWVYGTIVKDRLERLHRWRVDDGQLDAKTSFGASFAVGALGDDRWLVFNARGEGQTHFLRAVDFATGQELWRREVPFTGPAGTGEYATGAVAPDGTACALALVHGRSKDAKWRTLLLALPDLGVIAQEEPVAHRPLLLFGPERHAVVRAWADTGEIKLLSSATTPGWQLNVPASDLTALAQDGRSLLAIGSGGGSIALVDLRRGALVGSRVGHESSVQDVCFSPDGARLASTGNGGDVRLWPLQPEGPPVRLDGFLASTGGGRALSISPDGHLLAATDAGERVRIIAADGSSEAVQLTGALKPIGFTRRGTLWAIGTGGALEEHDLTTRRVRRELAPGLQPFIAALSADERTMACIDARGLLVFAEVASGQTTPPVNSEHGYPYWLALSPDGRQAATSGSNLSVCLWDIAARRCKATWTMTDQIANGAFSPDGRKLALVHKTGSLEIRDLQAAPGQERPITLVTSSGLLEGVAFHPSEPRLFVSGRDGFVHVFDTNRWEEVAQLRSDPAGQRTGKISRLAMPASGAWLAGFAESGVIRFWRR